MDGFILINKEIGETSNNVVQKVKKVLKAKKVGHLGTLDPIAEGLLILAVNKATKFSSYFLESDKSYEVKVELGKSTDTDDSSGKIIFESNVDLSKKMIRENLFSFIGESEQIPPFFSALKYQGKPLYKYAREGQFIKKPARKILIKEINDYKYSNKVCSFTVYCSKGTYIRSLARDLGEKLKCGAHMIALKRIRQHNFKLSDAVNILEISKEKIVPIEAAFNNFKKIIINSEDAKKFINGVKNIYNDNPDNLYKISNNEGIFLGIGQVKNKNLRHKQLV
jgi:tRNA pseudouridine55 synthase